MTLAESVEVTKAVRPRVVIPHHYDMIRFNTADVNEFTALLKREAPEQAVRVLRCGERWIYAR